MPRYIDAELVVKRAGDKLEYGLVDQEYYNAVRKEVDETPDADAAPVRHGRWYMRGGRPCCSECNTKALWADEGGTGGFSHEFVGAKSKWCPECGARMDKERTFI